MSSLAPLIIQTVRARPQLFVFFPTLHTLQSLSYFLLFVLATILNTFLRGVSEFFYFVGLARVSLVPEGIE